MTAMQLRQPKTCALVVAKSATRSVASVRRWSDDRAMAQRCRLCGKVAILQRSHIISSWTHVRAIMVRQPEEGMPNINGAVAVLSRGKVRASVAIRERMLCSPCEIMLSGCEGEIARLAIQEDSTFPALTAILAWPDACTLPFEIDPFVRFACACLWRASESKEYRELRLGERTSTVLAAYLRGERNDLDEDMSLTVDFVCFEDDRARVDRSVTVWASAQIGNGVQLDQFACFGIWFQLRVGGLPSDRPECFTRSHRIGLDKSELYFEMIALASADAEPVGAMRKFLPYMK